tara:strand:+ start:941 stop:1369 length:429 start_codon:yes stop_codon:yes gene_type:complete
MKKLTYLFLALIIVACSSDDSNSGQTFFEKYDGVVWQEDTPNNYLFRFQNIVNGNLITANTFFVEEGGSENCESSTLPISDFFDVSENSASVNEQEEYDGNIETWVTTITVTNNGNNLTIVYSDEPEYPEYYFRTTLNSPCD